MHHHREAEDRGLHVLDLGPGHGVVRAAEDAVVVLDPPHMGRGGALHHAVGILGFWRLHQLRRRVVGSHALGVGAPGHSAIRGDPHAAAGDRHHHAVAVPGIHADGVDSGHIGAAAHPLPAFRHVPEGLHQVPGGAEILAPEEAARQRAGPEHTGLRREPRRQAPEADEAPGDLAAHEVLLHVTLGRRGIGGHAEFLPGGAAIPGAVQLGAEVAVVQGRVPGAVTGILHGQGDVVPQKGHRVEVPDAPRRPSCREEPLAGGYEQLVGHGHPPDKACMT